MIIDTHCHAGRNWFLPIESLEFEMNQAGVDAAVLIQHGGTYDNSYLFKEASKRHGRFKVVVMIDPNDSDPLGTLEKLCEQGAAGVRIAPDGTFNHVPRVIDIWRKAGELGLVVSSLGDDGKFSSVSFKNIIDACPETQIVLEHLAGVGITEPPYSAYKSAL